MILNKNCNHQFLGISSMDDPNAHEACDGYVAICKRCGGIAIYHKDLLPHKISTAELDELKLKQPRRYADLMDCSKCIAARIAKT
jgi:hypothetical protein